MTAGLAGAAVIVTRPREQAGDLVEALEAVAGQVVTAPGIEIEALDSAAVAERAGAVLPGADWLVFISRNAVRHATASLGQATVEVPTGAAIAAVGPGTAAELRAWGWSVSAAPTTGGGGDALLATTAFTVARGERVVIVRGEAGRERLAEGLRARGASVDYLEVYRRCAAPVPAGLLASGWQSARQRVTIVTSDSGIRALVTNLPEAERRALLASRPVVISQRLAASVRELGFARTPVTAAGASTSEIVAAAEHAAVAEIEEMP